VITFRAETGKLNLPPVLPGGQRASSLAAASGHRYTNVYVALYVEVTRSRSREPAGNLPRAMKILFDHPLPFALAHGGFQTQIEQTKAALQGIGVEVEWLRWWDSAQTGDIIHYFGRPLSGYVKFAQQKGMGVVVSELLTGPGSRPAHLRRAQKLIMRIAKAVLPNEFTLKLAWDTYQTADAFVALTTWEKQLMTELFDADPARVQVIPNGVEGVFFSDPDRPIIRNGTHLVCTATITERKRVVELARAAVIAKVPVQIIGKPYSEADPYYREFLNIADGSAGIVQYKGPVPDREQLAEIYQRAPGFVLLSAMESLSLSALEAAASGCPLLLSDLPWARASFGSGASYVAVTGTTATADALHLFHSSLPQAPKPALPASWIKVAEALRALYAALRSGRIPPTGVNPGSI